MTVICTDKTGTPTMNQMDVVASSVEYPDSEPGIPTSPKGWLTLNAAVNSTAELESREGKLVTVGNSTEAALLRWLHRAGLSYQELRSFHPPVSQELFDSNRKQMSTVVTLEGRSFLLVKGAPEIVARRCTPSPDLTHIHTLASRAMRTLAFAHSELPDGSDPRSLTWDGYVGIRDEVRPDVPDAVRTCNDAGITVKMVTGDSPETATAIARETGILCTGTVLLGSEFRSLPEGERGAAARRLDVMARSEPSDKLLMVQALQGEGEVVAVTGDTPPPTTCRNRCPDEVKQERYERFMELASRISSERLAAKVGRRMRVLVDLVGDDGAIARSSADAPEIDGTVKIFKPGKLKAGDWADVQITGADEYDLYGELAR